MTVTFSKCQIMTTDWQTVHTLIKLLILDPLGKELICINMVVFLL